MYGLEQYMENKQDDDGNINKLKHWATLVNLVEETDLSSDQKTHEQVVVDIGFKALKGFQDDLSSMSEWLAAVTKIEKLANLEVESKTINGRPASNVKFPLITKACYDFASRVYPEIINNGKVVKGRVLGRDVDNLREEKCQRVTDYMNYQLLFEQEEWEFELDKLLLQLSLIGFVCKKSYYDSVRNIIKSELCNPTDLIINCNVKNLKTARRVSHILHYYLNDIIEQANSTLFCQHTVNALIQEYGLEDLETHIDVIEQHTFLDLDNDGYSEPYIVTFVAKSGQVLRIAPRFTKEMIHKKHGKLCYLDAVHIFTDYHFLTCPKGRFQSVGFGFLMLHINETCNSLLNQLVDAGTLANAQIGYKDARLQNMGSGSTDFENGELRTVKACFGIDLDKGIKMLEYKEPSAVLLKLLEMLMAVGKEFSSSTEVMTGSTSADNAKTGAVQALQQASLTVLTAVQRRIYRSLGNELSKIYHLNSIYLDPTKYYNFLEDKKVIFKEDFEDEIIDVIPVADPNLSSELQRNAQNQILLAAQQLAGVNKVELSKLVLQNSNIGVPVVKLMLTDQQLNQPTPEMIKLHAEIENWSQDKKLKAEEIHINQFKAKTDFYKLQAEIQYKMRSQEVLNQSQSMLNIAEAQAQQYNSKFQEYELQLKTISAHLDAMKDAADFMQQGQMHQDNMGVQQQQLDQSQQELDDAKEQNQQNPTSGMDDTSSD